MSELLDVPGGRAGSRRGHGRARPPAARRRAGSPRPGAVWPTSRRPAGHLLRPGCGRSAARAIPSCGRGSGSCRWSPPSAPRWPGDSLFGTGRGRLAGHGVPGPRGAAAAPAVTISSARTACRTRTEDAQKLRSCATLSCRPSWPPRVQHRLAGRGYLAGVADVYQRRASAASRRASRPTWSTARSPPCLRRASRCHVGVPSEFRPGHRPAARAGTCAAAGGRSRSRPWSPAGRHRRAPPAGQAVADELPHAELAIGSRTELPPLARVAERRRASSTRLRTFLRGQHD